MKITFPIIHSAQRFNVCWNETYPYITSHTCKRCKAQQAGYLREDHLRPCMPMKCISVIPILTFPRFTSPAVIIFHTSFQMEELLASTERMKKAGFPQDNELWFIFEQLQQRGRRWQQQENQKGKKKNISQVSVSSWVNSWRGRWISSTEIQSSFCSSFLFEPPDFCL